MADDQVTQTGEKSTKALSAKLEKVVEELEKLTVLELSEVVQALQERWGVSATPVAGPAVSAAPAEAAPQATGGVQTVVLTNSGGNKIAVIKALREINPNLGLKEAKDMSEKLPAEVLKDVKAEEAKNAQEKLTTAGATVEIK
ncbi:MAG: 50S ribosomal protein L7/L12 [Candidatus Blackburnbacteria bacterium RIFCSPHIGHO2_12_FULL_41_13b]|uniref:Large ribosomal subunit protein bL12 n=1 Tax=Candidatus Blackburnbacteria bacterium RIFCSPHIGHO2_12_FULL_41_13b TaxID=1797517 RepID=A0A1G1V8L0_9BACT|nr:MAG: 50S ribosomal protein L7/L12 [Candidatus Blackburnbacteria bacterium RIFCSPHIGHO2_12_FULL_41_13b]